MAPYDNPNNCTLVVEMSDASKLHDLIKDMPDFPAAKMTRRVGEHYEYLVGIGNDHTAIITVCAEGRAELERMMGAEV